MEIRPEILSGVRVVLREAEGRVEVNFFCSVEASQQVLTAIAQREATEMARRCRRDLLVRVQADDEDRERDSSGRARGFEVLAVA